ncbi:hypothetical protein [Streptomyces sp. JNUCC 63]
MANGSRIRDSGPARRIVSADEAAALIPTGATVGMSGFTGAGHPQALARRIAAAAEAGERTKAGVGTGASTAPGLDDVFAEADGVDLRLPYQSYPTTRHEINTGRMEYLDLRLSHVAQMAWQGSPSSRSARSPRTAASSRRRRSATTRPGSNAPTP